MLGLLEKVSIEDQQQDAKVGFLCSIFAENYDPRNWEGLGLKCRTKCKIAKLAIT